MVKTLFIAEKPSIARALASFIGGFKKEEHAFSNGTTNTKISWCYGHLFKNAQPKDYNEKYASWKFEDLPIIPTTWKLLPSDAKNIKPHLKALQMMLKEADVVIHAGDPDREGQLLVDELLLYYGYKKEVKRLLLNAQDDLSIERALANLENNKKYHPLYESALARSHLDWLLGMTGTRLYTLKAQYQGYKGRQNVGRVQTPTLALIVRREQEILNFKETSYYECLATLSVSEGNIIGKLDTDEKILDATYIDTIIDECSTFPKATITDCKVKERIISPPLPFSLASLQMLANKKWGWSAKKTLDITQSLYEKKCVSYPRSDCSYLPTSQFEDASNILSQCLIAGAFEKSIVNNTSLQLRSKAWNDSKITAHHAIIPTSTAPLSLENDEFLLYCLIATRYLLQFYPAKEILETSFTFTIGNYSFTGTINSIQKKGWSEIYKEEESSDTEPLSTPLSLSLHETYPIISIQRENKKTTPPKRFTEGTLLQAMENIHKFVTDESLKKTLKEVNGIGTPATRAAIIENLLINKFIKQQGKQLIPTEEGDFLIQLVPDNLSIPDRTAIMELKLSNIVNGSASYESVIKEYENELKELVNKESIIQESHSITCPSCNVGSLRPKTGKYGVFWGCSNYPNCKASFKDDNGQPLIKKEIDNS